ncbi:hypothetical protein SAMN05661044_04774 [Olivibacter domesticus]|uniref:Uncharacterized protein n=1 Tax=Olivibacter domesticus TaxID=407022 RepID=A0A1H7X7J7_OLID1|nr:hypothetical protein SAMN05661044_04774 [Olivibacter domesticus]
MARNKGGVGSHGRSCQGIKRGSKAGLRTNLSNICYKGEVHLHLALFLFNFHHEKHNDRKPNTGGRSFYNSK